MISGVGLLSADKAATLTNGCCCCCCHVTALVDVIGDSLANQWPHPDRDKFASNSTSYYSSHGSYRQREMCRPLCGHGCTCVCLSVPRRIPTLLNGPGCNLGESYRLSSSCAQLGGFAIGAWFRCYDNIAPNAKYQRVLVLALCLVFTARHNARIASAVLATAIPSVCPSVCLSICLSQAGIVSKRRHVARCSLHRWIAKCV